MGTRHLIAVQVDGEYKVAQYGQWDGYPSGQGAHVLEFLKKIIKAKKLATFKKKCKALRWETEEEEKARCRSAGLSSDQEWANIDEAAKLKATAPWNDRDAGAKILTMIMESKEPLAIHNSIDFANDSLFCEYAYVIDLDKKTLECFKGFNETTPLSASDRFYDPKWTPEPPCKNGDTYYPIKLQAKYKFSKLPSIKKFCLDVDPPEEED